MEQSGSSTNALAAIPSFGALLRLSWETSRTFVKPLCIGAVVISLLYALGAAFIAQDVQRSVSGALGTMGMDPAHFQELSERMQVGDDTAYQEMMQNVEDLTNKLEGMEPAEQERAVGEKMRTAFMTALPRLLGLMVYSVLLLTFANVYYLVIAVELRSDPVDAVRRSLSVFLPMLAVGIWMFLRSFGWIGILAVIPPLSPFAPVLFIGGIVCVFIFGPRLLFAPVLYLTGRADIVASASESIRLSKGYWGAIVVRAIGILLVIVLFQAVMMTAVRTTGTVSSLLSMYLCVLVQQLALAFMTIFLAHLSVAVIGNPKKHKTPR